LTLTSIQNYERGRNVIPVKRLEALACALHCEPNDLLMRPAVKS
jgi:DNA-binding Xre family transcriptional regulator